MSRATRIASRILLAVAMTTVTVSAQESVEAAEEAAVEAGIDAALMSAYVWRGQVLNDEMVLQPSITVGKGGVSAIAWGNLNLTDSITDTGEFNEIDLALAYGGEIASVEGLGYEVGVINYQFPNVAMDGEAASGTTEVYVGASMDVILAPAVTVYYDIDEVERFYVLLGLGHSVEIPEMEGASVDVGFTTGYGDGNYNDAYFGIDDAKIGDASISVSATFEAMPGLTVTPILAYSWFWDDDLGDAAGAAYFEKDLVCGGIAAAYAF